MIYIKRKVCKTCGKLKPIYEFRKDSNCSDGYRNVCKKCKNKYERKRLNSKRKECIEYKGGKCAICGIEYTTQNDYIFVFHHVNPADKCFDIGDSTYNLNDDKIIDELGKCILVCGNCHLYCHSKKRKGDEIGIV